MFNTSEEALNSLRLSNQFKVDVKEREIILERGYKSGYAIVLLMYVHDNNRRYTLRRYDFKYHEGSRAPVWDVKEYTYGSCVDVMAFLIDETINDL